MIEIREMTEADIEKVSLIEEECFSMPWKPDDFKEMIERDNMTYVVLLVDGEIAGGAGLRNILGDGEITNVAISNKYRGNGYSKPMMVKLLEIGDSLGCSAYTLEVRVSNEAAIKLYESVGFENVGVRPGFYEHPREDAYIFWKYPAEK